MSPMSLWLRLTLLLPSLLMFSVLFFFHDNQGTIRTINQSQFQNKSTIQMQVHYTQVYTVSQYLHTSLLSFLCKLVCLVCITLYSLPFYNKYHSCDNWRLSQILLYCYNIVKFNSIEMYHYTHRKYRWKFLKNCLCKFDIFTEIYFPCLHETSLYISKNWNFSNIITPKGPNLMEIARRTSAWEDEMWCFLLFLKIMLSAVYRFGA